MMSEGNMQERIQSCISPLLKWFIQNRRMFPWRQDKDPYHVWVSEIMLQQTRIEAAKEYYIRFMKELPDVQSLCDASQEKLLKLWEGLGYYSRVKNLHKAAKAIVEQYSGHFPDHYRDLLKLSGIGEYTAGAIASICFGEKVPAVDGNVLRVYSRLFGIRDNILLPPIRKILDGIASSIVPACRPGDYNQAVMDLGATVCVPGTPDCAACPLSDSCSAFANGDAADLPVIPGKVPQKVIHWTVAVLHSGSRTLVRQRTESLLQGLWCFPLLDCFPADAASLLAKKYHLLAFPSGPPKHARHVFTHLVWEMDILSLEITGPELPAPADYRWVSLEELDMLAFPVAMNAALKEAKKRLSPPALS